MTEEAAAPAAETATTTTTTTVEEDQRVPYERFDKVNKKAKEAAERATALEKQMADLKAQLDERESAGLPELEQTRKRLEQAEKRAAAAEKAAEERDHAVKLSRAERLVISAAKDFQDPEDATRFVGLADIEDADQAERAVKRIAKAKPHLLKAEDAKIPGKVLKDGRAVTAATADPLRAADEEAARAMLDEINRMRSQSGYAPGGLLSG